MVMDAHMIEGTNVRSLGSDGTVLTRHRPLTADQFLVDEKSDIVLCGGVDTLSFKRKER